VSEKDLLERVDELTQIVFPLFRTEFMPARKRWKYICKRCQRNFFPEGSYVYVRDPKLLGALLSHWDSPFKAALRTKGDSLTLEDLTGQLIEFDCAPFRMKLVQRNPVEDDTNTYEMYEILNHRPNKRGGGGRMRWSI
ncbi:hypothetical protein K457DRAFT_1779626, partial [Linnemannia elongata AG-77]